jgi:hypothetical protein
VGKYWLIWVPLCGFGITPFIWKNVLRLGETLNLFPPCDKCRVMPGRSRAAQPFVIAIYNVVEFVEYRGAAKALFFCKVTFKANSSS